jgi:hypothetical protein
MGSGSVLCEVCEERPAVRRCRICGRYVCEKHVNEEGVCAVCEDLMCRICNARLSVTSCVICGRPVCRSCSVELEPGIRVCKQCVNNLRILKEGGLKLGVFGDRGE